MTKVIPELESPIELRVVGKVVVVKLWVVGEVVVVVLWVYMKPKLNHFEGRDGRNRVEMFRPKTPESRNRSK